MADLNVQLILRLVDRATAPARSAMRALDRIGGEGFRRQVDRVNRGSHMMADGLGTVTGVALRGGAVLAGYAGTVGFVAGMLVRPAAQFEQLRVQLTNLEGSAAGAERAMAWIEEFSTRTPLQLEDTVSAYARLKAFGLDPTTGAMQALVDTMAASGGGVEQLDGLVMALGQAWTKEKLQGEEALQMLERGVPVWDLLGKKLGKTTSELQEMASKGQLGRREITLLIEAMAERNAGASEAMAKTWDGIISNILDHWGRFQRMIMGSGVFDYLKTRLQAFLDLLNTMAEDGRLQAYADQAAKSILAMLEGLWAFGQGAVETWNRLAPVIARVAEMLGGWENLAWFAAALLMSRTIFALIGGFLALGQGIVMVGTGLVGMAGYATGLAFVLGRIGVVLRSVLLRGFQLARAAAMLAGGAFQWLGRVLLIVGRAALANPIGIAVAAIAGAAYLIYRNWDSVAPWFGRLWDSVRMIFGGFYDFVAGIFTGDLGRAWDGIRQVWDGIVGYYRTLWDGVVGIFSWAWDNGIAPVLDMLGLLDPIKAAWQGLKDALGVVLDWISEKFAAVMTAIQPLIDGLKWVNDNGAAAVNSVTGGNKGPISSGPYTGGATGPIVPGAAVPGVTVPVGARALGGPVRAGMIYRWQEEGRELFVPRTDGQVISNRQLRAMQNMAAPPGGLRIQPVGPAPASTRSAAGRSLRMEIGGITINAAPGMDPREVARAVRRELEALGRSARFDLHDGGDYA